MVDSTPDMVVSMLVIWLLYSAIFASIPAKSVELPARVASIVATSILSWVNSAR